MAKVQRENIKHSRGGRLCAFVPLCLGVFLALTSCANTSSGPTGTSVSGYAVAVRVIPDTVPADSASQATVRVEVRDAYNNFVSGASVSLTATMGTLGGSSVTTTNGVATTTFTSGSKTGTGQIAATVENVTVVGKVSLTAVKTK